jgi:hypothetical protein
VKDIRDTDEAVINQVVDDPDGSPLRFYKVLSGDELVAG